MCHSPFSRNQYAIFSLLQNITKKTILKKSGFSKKSGFLLKMIVWIFMEDGLSFLWQKMVFFFFWQQMYNIIIVARFMSQVTAIKMMRAGFLWDERGGPPKNGYSWVFFSNVQYERLFCMYWRNTPCFFRLDSLNCVCRRVLTHHMHSGQID